MGYRSEVVLAIGKEAMPLFMHVLTKHPAVHELCYEHAERIAPSDFCEDGALVFRWEGVKWYEGYPDVNAITDLMDRLDEAETDDVIMAKHYRFVRVGEDSDDIVIRGQGFWDIHPVTSINIGY